MKNILNISFIALVLVTSCKKETIEDVENNEINTPVTVNPPCSPSLNSTMGGMGSGDYLGDGSTDADGYYGGFEVFGYGIGGSKDTYINFSSGVPSTGEYETISNPSISIPSGQANIRVNGGFAGFAVSQSGQTVYVENTGDSLFITFCNINLLVGSSAIVQSGNIRAKIQ